MMAEITVTAVIDQLHQLHGRITVICSHSVNNKVFLERILVDGNSLIVTEGREAEIILLLKIFLHFRLVGRHVLFNL